MKNKTKIILIFLITFFTVGCVKQRNCDCGVEGQFVYLDKSKDHPSGKSITAHFITLSFTYPYSYFMEIYGNIPMEYQCTDTMYVSICFNPYKYHSRSPNCIYKLTCIEKIN